MEYASKARLFELGLPEEDLEVPGVGTVRVRGLTRHELLLAGNHDKVADAEAHYIAFGMIEPQLTVEEVRKWQRSARSVTFQPITAKIRELSGHGQGAEKSDVPGDAPESDA